MGAGVPELMSIQGERRILRAIRENSQIEILLFTRDLLPDEPADRLPYWAAAIAATPKNGYGSMRDLRKAVLVPGRRRQTGRAFGAVMKLGRAIGDNDWYTAEKQISLIRHYAPDTDRNVLVRLLKCIASDGATYIKSDSDADWIDHDWMMRQLSDLVGKGK